MRSAMKAVGSVADRLLGMVVPHTVARAMDCDWECCGGGKAHYCCYYTGGTHKCGTCVKHEC
ncbi:MULTISPECIES: hypothetical protein [Dactylosporangium]|uniref:Uncharacterized protein n=2 Tax=Dactylosporangium TaxID=35753 RepID=A0A9W6KUE6_9ACTN|nr:MULTISPECIES: hypothetical protein [Dactylosporangium]UAB92855.1 hypothetical protein Dvina_31650 [Dactylosporangium vinaceum]UWZ41274.1 hypothetical protein Dmats_26740 [Dactylosporangium matsuzakiense]GLL05649.1 hypothetical protein GCM10017581_073960 [Dactylosporangium matsuzakiense]